MAKHSAPRRTPREYFTSHNIRYDLKGFIGNAWQGYGEEQFWSAVLFGFGVALGYFGSEAVLWLHGALTS